MYVTISNVTIYNNIQKKRACRLSFSILGGKSEFIYLRDSRKINSNNSIKAKSPFMTNLLWIIYRCSHI